MAILTTFNGQIIKTTSGSFPSYIPQPIAVQTIEIPADGLSVIMNYNEWLNERSVPTVGDFALSGTDSVVNSVTVKGRRVILGVDTAIFLGETVTLNYTAGVNPIEDLAGNDAANLVDENVVNNSEVPPPFQMLVDTTKGNSTVFDDWYLPSRDDLNAIYTNLYVPRLYDTDETDWTDYMSSSEYNNEQAHIHFFFTNFVWRVNKSSTNFIIRPVRHFTDEVGAYEIGDRGPGNGWIYYINGTTFYEVARKEDQTIATGTWSNITNILVGTDTAIGTGLSNTNAIVAQVGHTASAAQSCLDYSVTVEDKTMIIPTSGTNYDFTIDWGDGTIESKSGTAPSTSHTYAVGGEKVIKISGTFPRIYFNNSGDRQKLIKVLNWGDNSSWTSFTGAFYGCVNLNELPESGMGNESIINFQDTFRNCSSITSIPAGLFKDNTSVGASGFSNTFNGCTSLTSIPELLFRYNTQVSSFGFRGVFNGCSSITSIPSDLFRYNVNVSTSGFNNTFYNCTSLTSIPADLFRYNTSATQFANIFRGCTELVSIPVDLFRYNTLIEGPGFLYAFYGCSSLTSIPADLFRYNVNVQLYGFAYAFYGCSSLTSIPADLFRYNVNVSILGFSGTFSGCTSLTSIPADLFRYNVNIGDGGFTDTFRGCTNLQLNRNIFYADGEQGTRFLNRVSVFDNCFDRSSYSGVQGEAPDLWNCDFGTETPQSWAISGCFGGAGNSLTSLSNYADIPAAWK